MEWAPASEINRGRGNCCGSLSSLGLQLLFGKIARYIQNMHYNRTRLTRLRAVHHLFLYLEYWHIYAYGVFMHISIR